MTQKGYILIADISGYTEYLSQTELAHAQDILETLMQAMVENIQPPITISRIEGDGIFAYTTEDSFLQGQTLLEVVEHLYSVFAFQLEHIKRNTTCTCQACRRIPELGLKMVIHYGEFGLQHVANTIDLVGSSVIVAHRLMKNSIKETTEVSDYAFFTTDSIHAMHLDDFAEATMVKHTETYEHIGDVNGYVYNLKPVWQRDRERHRVFIPPEEAMLETSFELPVSPPIAWDYLLDPGVRKSFLGADKIDTSKVDGRMTVGSKYHCAHGDAVLDQVILDVQPFEYFTYKQYFFLPGKIPATVDITNRLDELPHGTQVTFCMAKPVSDHPLAKIVLKMGWNTMKKMLVKDSEKTEIILLKAIAANAAPEIPKIIIQPPTSEESEDNQ